MHRVFYIGYLVDVVARILSFLPFAPSFLLLQDQTSSPFVDELQRRLHNHWNDMNSPIGQGPAAAYELTALEVALEAVAKVRNIKISRSCAYTDSCLLFSLCFMLASHVLDLWPRLIASHAGEIRRGSSRATLVYISYLVSCLLFIIKMHLHNEMESTL